MLSLIPSPLVQFQLLHSKYHLCSASTRGILLSSYVKFINLFPEIKPQIQEVLKLAVLEHLVSCLPPLGSQL